MDSDGDVDLIWVSEYDPSNFVMWLGDGRGNFAIESNPQKHLARLQSLLSTEDHPRVSDDWVDRSTIGLVSVTQLPCLEVIGYVPPPAPASKKPTAIKSALSPASCWSILKKRGPPSDLS